MIAAALDKLVYRAIVRNPGIRADEIAASVKQPVASVRLSLARLKRAERVRTSGATRGAGYMVHP